MSNSNYIDLRLAEIYKFEKYMVSRKEPCIIISVYDGDTMRIKFFQEQLSQDFVFEESVRLMGIDTPELRSKNKNYYYLEKIAAKHVRDYIREQVIQNDWEASVEFCEDRDKYGRLLCRIFINNVNLNNVLVAKDYAKPYLGKKKSIWTVPELLKILEFENMDWTKIKPSYLTQVIRELTNYYTETQEYDKLETLRKKVLYYEEI